MRGTSESEMPMRSGPPLAWASARSGSAAAPASAAPAFRTVRREKALLEGDLRAMTASGFADLKDVHTIHVPAVTAG
jgi:hypothetical protein